MDPKNKITLFLMTEKGYFFLKNLSQHIKLQIEKVIVGHDPQLENDFSNDLIQLCLNENIPYESRSDNIKIYSEYALAVSWRWMINHPSRKLFILHDSLLPKYRGYSPLVNSLINKEKEIGVTAIYGDKEYDRGDIIAQSKIAVNYPITISEAIKNIQICYQTLGEFIFSSIQDEKIDLPSTAQDESSASYSIWRDEDDYLIDWRNSSAEIFHFINCVGHPYKGALTRVGETQIRILSAEVVPSVNLTNGGAGKVLSLDKGHPIVICGNGLIKITEAYLDDPHGRRSLIPLKKLRTRFY